MSTDPARSASVGYGRHGSTWLASPTTFPEFTQLDGDLDVDVIVIGAGITGMTTAVLLARTGRSVAVIDQDRVGSGTTGHSTAKVTSQHGLTYASLTESYGTDAARIYGSANEAAKERIAAFVDEGIDCGFRRRDAFVYAADDSDRPQIEAEAAAARQAGLPATLVADVPLPFATAGAMKFENQAEFDSARYLHGLADLLAQAGGTVHEQTRALGLSEGSPNTVRTERGEIRAGQVVVATLVPFLDRGGYFARVFPTRSYCLVADVGGAAPDAMLITASSPMRSIRSLAGSGGSELLMIGGESHDVGADAAQPERYAKLAEFAGSHWDVHGFDSHWSSQDFSAADSIPLVGRLHPFSRSVWVGTGFKKWGITGGTVAASLIEAAIAGREDPAASLFSSTRFSPRNQAPRTALENAKVAGHFFGDRIRERGGRPIADLGPGEGAIVQSGDGKVAGYRDDDGTLHAVSARCTHLYCQVKWNGAERSWDCPCHGSRFSVDGEVLNGPAVHPLPGRSTD